MSRIIRLVCFLVGVLLFTGQLLAQCGCMGTGCGSGCDCGCNQNAAVPDPRLGNDDFESQNMELLARVSLPQMGVTAPGVLGNAIWGWRHQPSGREFAIVGLSNGTAFVEITIPQSPKYLGTLPTADGTTIWRDVKVYNNRCYIVADGSGNANHGVQVFNLERLLSLRTIPAAFTTDARFTGVGRGHNIEINVETGFAYVVGSSSQNSSGGPIILDLNQGMMPVLVAVFNNDGYTHDVQVTNYRGPNRRLQGKEIAYCSNEDTLTILDVTNKSNIVMLSRSGYSESAYSHQGWLSENQDFFYMNDELDEQQIPTTRTRTHVWSVASLTSPQYVGFVQGTNRAIDHNLHVKGNFIFEANYTSGVRVLNARKASVLVTEEVGFFDTYPADNNVNFNGAWGLYPFFPSGSIIVSDRQNGLFILRFTPP